MIPLLIALIALAAGLFAVIAAIGILRFPDALSRMHAASKVATFAGALALIASAIAFGSISTSARAALAILFLYLTAPIAAHLIGRAALHRQSCTGQPPAPRDIPAGTIPSRDKGQP